MFVPDSFYFIDQPTRVNNRPDCFNMLEFPHELSTPSLLFDPPSTFPRHLFSVSEDWSLPSCRTFQEETNALRRTSVTSIVFLADDHFSPPFSLSFVALLPLLPSIILFVYPI